MRKNRWSLLALVAAFALLVSACGDDTADTTTTTAAPATTEATTTTAAPATTEGPMAATPVKVCQVTDFAGVDDRSFNQSAWEGIQEAVELGYATEDSFFIESSAAEDWQANIDQMLGQGCEQIVATGFAIGETMATNAAANPDVIFTMIDNVFTDADFNPLLLPNAREAMYQTDEAAFAAGYLSAGVSESKILCTYGGGNFPTVSIFMDGFARGAAHYAEVKGVDVTVLGWDTEAKDGVFTGSFVDMGLARTTADGLLQEGCDVILGVGGAIHLPAGDAIFDGSLDAAMIGVDVDNYFSMPEEYQSLWLTTVEKALSEYVVASIKDHAEGTWEPGLRIGTLENGGVGLAPFHDWDGRVSAELRAEVDQILADVASGAIDWDKFLVGY
jgi:basic membrane protein A